MSDAGPNGEVLAAYARVPELGWAVVADRPASNALASMYDSQNAAFGLLLGAILLAAVVGSLLARALASPLAVLSRATGALARGDSALPLPHSGSSEIQELVAAFREMRDRLAARTTQLDFERTRWQTTVESMPDMVTVCDAAGCATYVNPAQSRLFGCHVEPGLALQEHPVYYRILRPDGTPFAVEDLPLQRAALHGEEARDVEIVLRTPAGEERSTLWDAAPLRGPREPSACVMSSSPSRPTS